MHRRWFLGALVALVGGALAALADHLLPGAAKLGAVAYLEQLLSAFDHNPPRIFAGGPFSGRRPFARGGIPTQEHPPARFEQWLSLDRVQERAWRLRLYGWSETSLRRARRCSRLRRASIPI